jgi:chromate reductase
MKVAVLVGSLRKESYNRQIARALIDLAPPSLQMNIIDLAGLSFYNQDFDENPPADWKEFRQKIRESDAVLFVTPEYNRSIPGVLKNAIDVGSRPYGESCWDAKPAAVISGSTGAIGGFGANHHLRQCLMYLNMPCMPHPEAYIGKVASLFGPGGEINRDDTRQLLNRFIENFSHWVQANSAGESVEPLRKSG